MSSSATLSTGSTPTAVYRRKQERDHLTQLNQRFAAYMSHVHQVQEQTRSIENATLTAHTAALDAEIEDIRQLYEQELASTRAQLDDAVKVGSCNELQAKKFTQLNADLEKKLSVETNCRRKLETALVDAHRTINEKETSYQEAKLSLAELKNTCTDVETERNTLRNNLTIMTNQHDSEAAARKECEAAVRKLEGELEFSAAQYEKDFRDIEQRLCAAQQAIKVSEEKLREHDAIDEQLSQSLVKAKQQNLQDFQRYAEESEHSYNACLNSVKKQLEKAVAELEKARKDNIRMKAEVQETRAKCDAADAKCAVAEDKCKDMVHGMEMERQKNAADLDALEEQNRELEATVCDKVRELTIERRSNLSADGELDGLSGLLEAGEQRLGAHQKHTAAAEIISKSSSRRPLVPHRPVVLRKPLKSVTPIVIHSPPKKEATLLPPIVNKSGMVAPPHAPAHFMAGPPHHHPFMGAHPSFGGPAGGPHPFAMHPAAMGMGGAF